MTTTPAGPAMPEVTHHRAHVNGTTLHYVAAGTAGSPILLVHGFPETWRAFHKLIPLLAAQSPRLRRRSARLRRLGHRAGRLRQHGLGRRPAPADRAPQLGPVHLTGQDISGATVFRLATTRPEDVLSFTAIEMGLAGFGLEMLADITHGGAWHIGVLAAPAYPRCSSPAVKTRSSGG